MFVLNTYISKQWDVATVTHICKFALFKVTHLDLDKNIKYPTVVQLMLEEHEK